MLVLFTLVVLFKQGGDERYSTLEEAGEQLFAPLSLVIVSRHQCFETFRVSKLLLGPLYVLTGKFRDMQF